MRNRLQILVGTITASTILVACGGGGEIKKADYAVSCRSDKNGMSVTFVVGGDRGIYTGLHSQQYMKLKDTSPSTRTFINEYEWTTFYGPLEKRDKEGKYEFSRDNSRVNYFYVSADGQKSMDPFSCEPAQDPQAILQDAKQWLISKQQAK